MRARAEIITAVAAGGAAGALARYGVGEWLGQRPVTTLAVNLAGCLLIGVLAVLAGEVWAGHRLLRPLLGTGVLGGFTTFSAYAVDTQRLLADGRLVAACGYLAGTLAGALLAVQFGVLLGRSVGRTARR